MFCENCGKQNPDGAAFCEHCGARAAGEAAPAAPVATAAPAKKFSVAGLIEKAKAIHQKNKLIFPIAGAVLAVAIALIVVFSILGKQVSMKNYLNITVEGYNGYGTMYYEFGDVSFGLRAAGDKDCKEFGDGYDDEYFLDYDKSDVSKDYRDNLKKAQQLVDSIEIEYTLPEGKTNSTLANGDVITFTIEIDEKVAEKLGLTILDTTFEYTVEGLKALEQFDVLSYFDLIAEGYDGYGTVKLQCNQSGTKQVGDFTFEMEEGAERIRYTDKDGYTSSIYVYIQGDSYNKANGDKVEVKLDIYTEGFVNYGVEITGLEKEYTVEGLKETTKVDLLQYYTVQLTGLNGSGRANAAPTQEKITIGDYEVDLQTGEWTKDGEYVARTSVYFNDSYGLSNGDEIKFYVSYSEYTFREMGIQFINTEQLITVSNLAEYITDLASITDYTKAEEQGKEAVTDALNNNWNYVVHENYKSYTDTVIGEDMKLHKALLALPKESSYYNNFILLVFSVTLSDNEITTPTTYYVSAVIKNASVYGDGALNGDDTFSIIVAYASYEELYQAFVDANTSWTFYESEQF